MAFFWFKSFAKKIHSVVFGSRNWGSILDYGYVKIIQDLIIAVNLYFNVKTQLIYNEENVFLLAKSKKFNKWRGAMKSLEVSKNYELKLEKFFYR